MSMPEDAAGNLSAAQAHSARNGSASSATPYPQAQLIVAKVGSSTLCDETGAPDKDYIASLAHEIAQLAGEGKRIVLISSGAAAAGRERLGFSERPHDIESLQACAAAGQAALTEIYAAVFSEHGLPSGQVLLTRRDLVDRQGYLNARNTLCRLLELGAVPIVNENDTVSVAEFAFGDNDTLGAIVAAMVGADLYVILSDIDGLYTANPRLDPQARLISKVDAVTPEILAVAGEAGTSVGTGGMRTKVRAARAALAAGIPTVICAGREPGALAAAAHGRTIGTRFEAPEGSPHESGRKLWIGLTEVPQGTLYLDAGATRAVCDQGASILPVGVTRTEGSYEAGDVVNVVSPEGILIGRGVCRYSSQDMVRVRGLQSDIIARFLPEMAGQPAIHRDELLVL